MPIQATVYRILVASPNDVKEERNIVREVILEWNTTHAQKLKIILEPILWESHSVPEMGDRPQAIINKQLLENSDLLIGIFWTRIGTHTGKEESGSVEEIIEFIKAGKPIMLYFSQKPIPPLQSIDQSQLDKLLNFKEKCKKKGLFFEYNSDDELSRLLMKHISKHIDAIESKKGTSSLIKSKNSKEKITQKGSSDLSGQIKKLLSKKKSVEIIDLINKNRNAVLSELTSEKFEIDDKLLASQGIKNDEEFVVKRFYQCERLIEPMCKIFSAIGYYDIDGKYGNPITQAMENLAPLRHFSNSRNDLLELQLYPLFLVYNATGVTSLINNKYQTLAALMLKPKFIKKNAINNSNKQGIVEFLTVFNVFSNFTDNYCFDINNTEKKSPVWEHVYNCIFTQVTEYIPNKLSFIEEMQKFKFLSAMVHLNSRYPNINDQIIKYELSPFIREMIVLEWLKGPDIFGRFPRTIDKKAIFALDDSLRGNAEKSKFLKTGFFNGDTIRYLSCFNAVRSHPDFMDK